jgi:hypothetical protein
VRGPGCILEGALRFASALFGEVGRDGWSLVRERLTHSLSVADSPCTFQKPAEPKTVRDKNTRNLGSKKGTPDQSGMTVIEALFFSDGDIWLHENCGGRQCAEHDLGRIVIRNDGIAGMRGRTLLKVKLDISKEGLLFRDPVLETSRGQQIPITWESSNNL